MLILFQLLFTLFALYAMVMVGKRKKQKLLGPKGFVFWMLFWISSIIVVMWPDSAAKIARMFGIGRGSDFVLYVSIALLFFLVFKLHIKLESIGRDVTTVIRKNAVDKQIKK